MKKHVTLIALALVLCLLFSACGSSASPAGTAKADKILTVQVGPNPETLDPALNSAVDGGNMLLHLDECLLTADEYFVLGKGDDEAVRVVARGTIESDKKSRSLKDADLAEVREKLLTALL